MPAVLKELLTSRNPRTTSKSQGSPINSPEYTPYDEDFSEENDKGADVKVSIVFLKSSSNRVSTVVMKVGYRPVKPPSFGMGNTFGI